MTTSRFQRWPLPPDRYAELFSLMNTWHCMEQQAQIMLDRITRCCTAIPGCPNCTAAEIERDKTLKVQASVTARLIQLRAACWLCGDVDVLVDENSVCERCADA